MKQITYLLLFLLSFQLSASIWKDTFYTDKSSYYLQLNPDGFVQQFRVHRSACDQIENAYISFKNRPEQKFEFSRILYGKKTSFRKQEYGLRRNKYCWFQVVVTNVDLNAPKDNFYTIQIREKNSNKIYAFNDVTDSLLPSKRFSDNNFPKEWISLGKAGPTIVNGGGVFYKIWESTSENIHIFVNDTEIPISLTADQEIFNPRTSFSVYLPHGEVNDIYHYRYLKNGEYELLEVANNDWMSPIKIDPMAKKLTYEAKGGYFNGYIKPQSIVDRSNYLWKSDLNIIQHQHLESYNNWIIYQLWPLTFNPIKEDNKFLGGTFKTIEKKISYLKELGINAIEFLPLHETRFHGSWGYALDSLILIEKNYGSKKDLKTLIDKLHQKGIRVVFDIVINHVNNSLLREPLSARQQTSKLYKGNTDWGPKPDFDNIMVRQWIADSLLYLQREYHLDGYRFDMTKYIYDGNRDGYAFLQELNQLFKIINPYFYSTSEELPDFVPATNPISEGGQGFSAQWNDLFKNFFENTFTYYRPNNLVNYHLENIQMALQGFGENQYGHRNYFGPPTRSVNYLGSHDFIGNKNPILRIVSDFDQDPRIKESDGPFVFSRVRPLENPIDKENKFRMIHNHFTHDVAKLGYGILFTKPGAALFFQGEEASNDINIENEWLYLAPKNGILPSKNLDINRFVGSHRMPWSYINPVNDKELSFLTPDEVNMFTGYHQYIKDLIKFKSENHKLNNTNARNVHIENNLLTYELHAGENDFFVVVNFGSSQIERWVFFPGNTNIWWAEIINSSNREYGSDTNLYQNIISPRGQRHNHMRLHSTSISIFKKSLNPSISESLYLRGTFNNWKISDACKLEYNVVTENFESRFYIAEDQNVEFKLATPDWEIELGQAEQKRDAFTYRPNRSNVKRRLSKGNYSFSFNPNSFSFKFKKL